jgi:hypothetical protein
MGFPAEIFDKQKVNYMQKCFYLINLIKNKDATLWENYRLQFEFLKAEDSWDFYQELVTVYKGMIETPAPKKTAAKKAPVAAKKKAPAKKKAAPKKKAPSKKK